MSPAGPFCQFAALQHNARNGGRSGRSVDGARLAWGSAMCLKDRPQIWLVGFPDDCPSALCQFLNVLEKVRCPDRPNQKRWRNCSLPRSQIVGPRHLLLTEQ